MSSCSHVLCQHENALQCLGTRLRVSLHCASDRAHSSHEYTCVSERVTKSGRRQRELHGGFCAPRDMGVSTLGGGARGGRSRGGLACSKASQLSTQVHQHVVLIQFDIGREDPACLLVKRLGGELHFECMEDRDYPLDSLWTVLQTQGWDSRNGKGFASVGAGFRGPGPVKWVSINVVEDQVGDRRGSELRPKGAFGEGMVTLSNL